MLNQRIGPIMPCILSKNRTVQQSTRYGNAGLPLIIIAKTAIISRENVVPQKPILNILLRGMVFIK